MSTRQWRLDSKIGSLYLVASENGLRGVFWKKQAVQITPSLRESGPEIRILERTVKQLEDYLKGRRKRFDLPRDTAGTVFQKQVWNALDKIPYGKTTSYQDIARNIKNSKAVRAVGTANGRNPLCIIVPCHRVIAADGSLGGYSGGLSKKKKLLALEQKSDL